jgi:hypothetical protein
MSTIGISGENIILSSNFTAATDNNAYLTTGPITNLNISNGVKIYGGNGSGGGGGAGGSFANDKGQHGKKGENGCNSLYVKKLIKHLINNGFLYGGTGGGGGGGGSGVIYDYRSVSTNGQTFVSWGINGYNGTNGGGGGGGGVIAPQYLYGLPREYAGKGGRGGNYNGEAGEAGGAGTNAPPDAKGTNGGNGGTAGVNGFGIYIEQPNLITNLYNSQGGSTPLYIANYLPTNYFIKIIDNNKYGILRCTLVTPSVKTNFNIDPTSTNVNVGQIFTNVIPKDNVSVLSGSIVNSNLQLLEWILVDNGTTGFYNLHITNVSGAPAPINISHNLDNYIVVPKDYIDTTLNVQVIAAQSNINTFINNYNVYGGGGSGGITTEFNGVGTSGKSALYINSTNTISTLINKGIMMGGGGGGGACVTTGSWVTTTGANGTNTGYGGKGGNYIPGATYQGGSGGAPGVAGNPGQQKDGKYAGGGGGGTGASGGLGNAYGGNGGYGIENGGNIVNLYNSQGGNQLPLYIKGQLPMNYYMIINDNSGNYGQLWGDASGTTLFNIDFASSNINLSGTEKTYAKAIKKSFVATTTINGIAGYNATLVINSDTNYYDLKLTKI